MKTYIGTKVIKAKPMTKKEYCDYRGWEVPPGEDPTEEIMLVEYAPDPKSEPNHPDHKGYISMSPMHVFEEAYKPMDSSTTTFAVALEAAKQGKRIARVGWNGKGMFAFKQVHADITMDIVPNMQSLPQAVKDEFMAREASGKEHAEKWGFDPVELNTIRYRNQFCIVYPDNTIYSWVPSANDICNDDWVVYD